MAEFVPTKGHANCPKCGGWQVLDLTVRSKNGWPIGALNYVDCDHCKGKGEIASSWPVAPEPSWTVKQPLRPMRVAPAVPVAECDHETTLTRVNLQGTLREEVCADCGELLETETIEPKPEPGGWAVFKDK